MTIFFTLLMLVIFVGVFASIMNEGLWSNAISLINVVIAGLLATNYFEPVANWLEAQVPSGKMFWDIIAVWGVFAFSFGLMRFATDQVSRYRVRFKAPLERLGGFFFGAWVAWVFLCFTMMTLHTAPLSRNFMFLAFRPEERLLFGLAPDRRWLGFMNKMSRTTFSRWPDEDDPRRYEFDPYGQFMPKYATRRENYEKDDTFLGR